MKQMSPAPKHAGAMPAVNGRCLSRKRCLVVVRAAHGLPDKQIAADLRVSLHTVNTHWRRIFQKLGVHSRMAAMVEVQRLGVSLKRVT